MRSDLTAENRCALIYTTILRPDLAKRFHESVRLRHPDLKIYCGDQSGTQPVAPWLSEQDNDAAVALPYNCGLSAARNRLVSLVDRDYFILAEDDMVVRDRLPIAQCVRFLDDNEDFVCVGGSLTDFYRDGPEWRKRIRNREGYLIHDSTSRGVFKLRLGAVPTDVVEHDGNQFTVVDYVANWGVFRTSVFRDNSLEWDERFKIGGQHLDFFLRIKLHYPHMRVGYYPPFHCEHYRDRVGPYKKLRRNRDWVAAFKQKWNLNYYADISSANVYLFDDYFAPPHTFDFGLTDAGEAEK